MSDWSSDGCSSVLTGPFGTSQTLAYRQDGVYTKRDGFLRDVISGRRFDDRDRWLARGQLLFEPTSDLSVRLIADYAKRNEDCCAAVIQPASDTVNVGGAIVTQPSSVLALQRALGGVVLQDPYDRSEEHTSELQSLMRISYAVFCLKKKKQQHKIHYPH